jgi:hypothetical protein
LKKECTERTFYFTKVAFFDLKIAFYIGLIGGHSERHINTQKQLS